MDTETIIHSNGSKWEGQKPDTIEKLIEMLGNFTIEERFFSSWISRNEKIKKEYQMCPIDKNVKNDSYIFFGNFEEISHVFRIETNDKRVVGRLAKAIMENSGWLKYYEKNLLTNK